MNKEGRWVCTSRPSFFVYYFVAYSLPGDELIISRGQPVRATIVSALFIAVGVSSAWVGMSVFDRTAASSSSITIASRSTEIVIDADRLAITGLRNLSTDQFFEVSPEEAVPLADFGVARDGVEYYFDSFRPSQTLVSESSSGDLSTLEIVWSGFDHSLEDLSIIAVATADSTDDWIRWDFRFESTEPISVIFVVGPRFAPDMIDGQPMSDTLYGIVPTHDGLMIEDVLSSLPETGLGGGVYPSWEARYQALLVGENRGGYVVAALDGRGEPKSFRLLSNGKSIEARITHLRPRTISSLHVIPYSTAIATYDDQWSNGVEHYRRWTASQSWAQGPTLVERSDVPDWFLEPFFQVELNSYDSLLVDQPIHPFSEVPTAIERFAGPARAPVVLRWTGWERHGRWVSPEAFPPAEGLESLVSAIDEIHRSGNRVILGLSAGLWDKQLPGFDTVGVECAVKRTDGSFEVQFGGIREFVPMSPRCPEWREIIVETAIEVAKTGADGVSLDAFLHYPSDFDRDEEIPGEYSVAWTDGLVALLSEVRAATKKVNAHFLIGTEGIVEPLLPYVDFYMTDGYDMKHMSAGLPSDLENVVPVPVVQILFGDRIVSHGREMGRYAFSAENRDLLYRALSFGVVPEFGAYHVSSVKYEDPETQYVLLSLLLQSLGRDLTLTDYTYMPRPSSSPSEYSDRIGVSRFSNGDISVTVTVDYWRHKYEPSDFAAVEIDSISDGQLAELVVQPTDFRVAIEVEGAQPGQRADLDSLHDLDLVAIWISRNGWIRQAMPSVAAELESALDGRHFDLPKALDESAPLLGTINDNLLLVTGSGLEDDRIDVPEESTRLAVHQSVAQLHIWSARGAEEDSTGYRFLEELSIPLLATTDFDVAKRIYPDTPEWSYFGGFIELLEERGLAVDTGSTPIDRLLLIVPPPVKLTTDVAEEIAEMIHSGSNLLLFVGGGGEENANLLSRLIGVQHDAGYVASTDFLWDIGSFEWPISTGSAPWDQYRVLNNWGVPAYIESPELLGSRSFAFELPEGAYAMPNRREAQLYGAIGGTYGEGSVVVIADNMAKDANLPTNISFIRWVIDWLDAPESDATQAANYREWLWGQHRKITLRAVSRGESDAAGGDVIKLLDEARAEISLDRWTTGLGLLERASERLTALEPVQTTATVPSSNAPTPTPDTPVNLTASGVPQTVKPPTPAPVPLSGSQSEDDREVVDASMSAAATEVPQGSQSDDSDRGSGGEARSTTGGDFSEESRGSCSSTGGRASLDGLWIPAMFLVYLGRRARARGAR